MMHAFLITLAPSIYLCTKSVAPIYMVELLAVNLFQKQPQEVFCK